jgi:uncharacterized protein (TIGR02391 family)
VWNAARSLWETKHYRQAVQTAFTSLNVQIQTKVGRRDVSDDKLIQETFSLDKPKTGQPRLRVPGDRSDPTVQSKQRGLLQLALGCAWAIRNPATHEDKDWDEHDALEKLAVLSVIARMIDQSSVDSV